MLLNSLYLLLVISLIGLTAVSFALFIRRLIMNSTGIYNEQRQINEKLDYLIQLSEEGKAEERK